MVTTCLDPNTSILGMSGLKDKKGEVARLLNNRMPASNLVARRTLQGIEIYDKHVLVKTFKFTDGKVKRVYDTSGEKPLSIEILSRK